jgi:hypothetical protein
MLIQFFDEITKDKQPNSKVKQTKNVFEEFLKHMKKVETDLLNEINLLSMASTGNPHEGSIYGAKKDYDLSKMQFSLISAQINSLVNQLNSPLQDQEDSTDSSDDENQNENLEEDNQTPNGYLNGHMNGNNEH